MNSGPSSLNPRPAVREGRSYSTNYLLQAPPLLPSLLLRSLQNSGLREMPMSHL
uniref:Uncharacterized protein n=1 Tax=Anguilla anguilla TaxID=7936 RepID=A0A0E9XZB7_ANGAN